MRLSAWKLFSTLAIPGMLAATTAVQAQQSGFQNAFSLVSAQEPQPEAKPMPAVAAPVEKPVLSGHDCCDKPCKQGGFIGGAEILFLKPANSEGIAPLFDTIIDLANSPLVAGALGAPINEPDFGLESSYRLWLGWQSAGGLGFRATYFNWDNGAAADSAITIPLGGGIPVGINLDYRLEGRVLDLEVTDTITASENYLITLSAGFRYVEYIEENRLGVSVPTAGFLAPELLTAGFNSRDYGIVLGADVHRRIGRNLALFVGTRASAVYGDQDIIFRINAPGLVVVPGVAGLDLTERDNDNVKFLFEGRVGGEWTRETARGALAFVRVAAELQYWDKFTGTPIPLLGNSQGAFGLIGLGVSAGISR